MAAATKALAPADGAWWQRLARLVGLSLRAPAGLVVGAERLLGGYGLSPGFVEGLPFDRKRLLADPATGAWLEAPILGGRGEPLGSLAAADRRGRRWSAHDSALLEELAALAAAHLADPLAAAPPLEALPSHRAESLRPGAPRFDALMLDSILGSMEELLVVLDPERQVWLANAAARRLFGPAADPLAWPAPSGVFLGDAATRCPPDAWPPHQALAGARVFEMELLVRPPGDSEGRWLSCAASPLIDADGEISGAVCLARDITTTREATLDLIEQSRRVGLLQRAAVAANERPGVDEALREILGLITEDTGWPVAHVYLRRAEELAPSDLWVVRDPLRYQPFIDATMSGPPAVGSGLLERAAAQRRASWHPDLVNSPDFQRAAAARRCGLAAGIFLPLRAGEELLAIAEFYAATPEPPREGLIELLENIGGLLGRVFERERSRQALQAYAEEVRALSLVDELTGLYNRRGFLTLAEQQVRIGHRTKMRHHLVFADIDHMKAINDTHGHAAGDQALRDTAALLRSTFRESDVLARLGGDEFVAFAADTVLESGEKLIARLREALAEQGARPYALSISFGYTLYDPQRPRNLVDLLGEADASMYEEKRRRRASRAG